MHFGFYFVPREYVAGEYKTILDRLSLPRIYFARKLPIPPHGWALRILIKKKRGRISVGELKQEIEKHNSFIARYAPDAEDVRLFERKFVFKQKKEGLSTRVVLDYYEPLVDYCKKEISKHFVKKHQVYWVKG